MNETANSRPIIAKNTKKGIKVAIKITIPPENI
jgi:hypothetical protein